MRHVIHSFQVQLFFAVLERKRFHDECQEAYLKKKQ